MNILVIEDNKTIAELLQETLAKESYNVDIADTGKKAESKLLHTAYNLVLLDLVLPDTCGGEILLKIRKTKSDLELPVVIVSSTNDEGKIAEMLSQGANDFILKPFSELILKTKIKNILRLHQNARKLKQQANTLNEIINNIPVLSLVVDENVRVLGVNRSFEEKFGLDDNSFKNNLFGDIVQCIHAISSNGECGNTPYCSSCVIRKTVKETHQQKQSIFKREGKFELVSGSERKTLDLLVSTTFIEFQGKQNVLLSIDDVSNERELLDKLKASEQKYRRIVETTNSLVTNVDVNGKLVYVNNVSETIYGLSPEACLGRNAFDFVHPDDMESTKLAYGKWLVSDNETFQFENRQLSVTGDIHYLKWNISKTTDSTGALTGFTSIAVDVTEEHQIREALLESNFLLNEFSKIANIGGWKIDVQNNTVTWTDETYRIHEIDKNDTPTLESAIRFYDHESVPIITKAVKEAIEHGTPYDDDLYIVTAKGNRKAVKVKGEAIQDKNGNVIEIRGIFQDITLQKKNEYRLIEKEKLLLQAQKIAHSGFYSFDIDAQLWKSSETLDNMFGINAEYPKNVESFLNIVHPADREMIRNYLFDNVLFQEKNLRRSTALSTKRPNRSDGSRDTEKYKKIP